MTEHKKQKGFFAKHAKSSAAMISLGIHGILVVVALSFVAVTVINKEEKSFEAKQVKRPRQKLKKLQVPVKINKSKPKPKLRKRVVVKNVQRKTPEFKMPEITGVKGGLGNALGEGLGSGASIGFTMPEINFFGAKAKGERVVFVVHFGPATIGNDPFRRMTGLTIRNRLEDLVGGMPPMSQFNVIAYYAGDADAIHPEMMMASDANKKMVKDWMEPVNPLEGNYSHCFAWGNAYQAIGAAKAKYPTRVENLPSYSLKWAYPYEVPKELERKYLPADANGRFMHWNRAVAWAILEQKADTIFVLTTNYIDAWGQGAKGKPKVISDSFKKMCLDTYGPDKKRWPTINVVVLAGPGDLSGTGVGANKVLNEQFGPIWKGFKGDGSVIADITKFMTSDEKKLYREYAAKYGNKTQKGK